MQLPKISVFLLALLLAAVAMVPIVSAVDSVTAANQDLIELNDISVETAQEHATITLLSMIQTGALDSNWAGAKINPAPQEIFDVNGGRLFYLFSVEKKGERVGEIYAAASKVLGAPVITIGSINEPDTAEKMQKHTQNVLEGKYSGYQKLSEKIVCFDYPVLGSMISLQNIRTAKVKTVIIDSRDGSEKNLDTQVSSFYRE